MVLLHGLASTHHWWDLVTHRLPGRQIIAVDHRGHGHSSTPPGGYTIAGLAADTATVLDTLHLRQVVVAGHSLGAAVALHLAADRPDLAAALCLVDGGLYDPKILFGSSWWDAQHAMRLDRRIAPTPAMLTAWARGRGLPDAAVPALLANYQPTSPSRGGPGLRLAVDHERHLTHSLWHTDPAALLTRSTAPVTALLARPADPVTAARHHHAAAHTLGRTPRPVTVAWADGSHDLPLEHPSLVAGTIHRLTHHHAGAAA